MGEQLNMSAAVSALIQTLGLEPHIEGGFYKRSYASSTSVESGHGLRVAMSSIYYLLTQQQPIGHWHRNRSDIMHYFHAGSALTYWLISPQGCLSKHILSNDITEGLPQLLVPGGYWKATHLKTGDYGLLSEAVCPGFDFADMELAEAKQLLAQYPQHEEVIKRYCRAGH